MVIGLDGDVGPHIFRDSLGHPVSIFILSFTELSIHGSLLLSLILTATL